MQGQKITKDLVLWYTNADCLRNKIDELKKRIHTSIAKPHIIAITEVKPKHSRFILEEAELQLEGYMLIAPDLGANSGRGVALYVDITLGASELTMTSNFCESCSIQLSLQNGRPLEICVLYRSPNSSPENNQALLELLQSIQNRNPPHLVVVGDFNLPEIDWKHNGSTPSETSFSAHFVQQTQEGLWHQHVLQPTRARGGNTPSLLDLLFTNNEDLIADLQIESPLGNSDHSVLHCLIKCSYHDDSTPSPFLNWNKANFSRMKELLNIDWNPLLDTRGKINDIWNNFHTHIIKSVAESVPLVTPRGKRAQIPIDASTRAQIRRKHRLWRRYMETRDPAKYREYTRSRNKLRNSLRTMKKQHEKTIANAVKENPKKFWKYVSEKSKKKSHIPDLKDSQGVKINSDKGKADALGKFFSSVMVLEPEGPLPQICRRETNYPWATPFTREDLIRKLRELNPNKSQGPDNIHPRILIESVDQLTDPLLTIFNISLAEMKVPDAWKEAVITAVHKKGSRALCDNYRPISLTSIVCKLMEKLIRDKIMKYMKDHKLFSNKQYGFLPGRSTVLQLLKVLDEWTDALDQGLAIEAIYMDFKKAFDSVPHRRLLYKMEALGIKDPVLSWTKSFLQHRSQYVRVNGSTSTRHKVTSGIPQGSVLGPILFVLYINDLPKSITSRVMMFADDTKIYQLYPNRERPPATIQDDLLKLDTWSSTWLLSFHPNKCHQLVINRSRDKNPVATRHLPSSDNPHEKLNLATTPEEKDLGITVDNNLTFERHIDSICSKARRIMGLIRRTFDNLQPDIFKPLYVSLVRSHLEYGQSVWSPYTKRDINKLESVQRAATKQINGFRNLPYPDRLRKLNLPTLKYRRRRGDMIEVYKILQNTYDPDCAPHLQRSGREGRSHNFKLFKPQVQRLDIRKHSFTIRIVDSWNSLPYDVVNAPSLNSFKNRLDKSWSNCEFKFDHNTP